MTKLTALNKSTQFVAANIPDKNIHPKAYETVTKCLMHGPCGAAFPNACCMKEENVVKNTQRNSMNQPKLTIRSYNL